MLIAIEDSQSKKGLHNESVSGVIEKSYIVPYSEGDTT